MYYKPTITYHKLSLKHNKYITTSLSTNATPKRPALSLSNGFLGPVQADDIFEPGTTKAGSFTNKDILPANSGYLPAIYGMIGYFLECWITIDIYLLLNNIIYIYIYING